MRRFVRVKLFVCSCFDLLSPSFKYFLAPRGFQAPGSSAGAGPRRSIRRHGTRPLNHKTLDTSEGDRHRSPRLFNCKLLQISLQTTRRLWQCLPQLAPNALLGCAQHEKSEHTCIRNVQNEFKIEVPKGAELRQLAASFTKFG